MTFLPNPPRTDSAALMWCELLVPYCAASYVHCRVGPRCADGLQPGSNLIILGAKIGNDNRLGRSDSGMLALSLDQLSITPVATAEPRPEVGCPRWKKRRADPMVVGHPFRGTQKKMNGSDEQEIRELIRLKHHSHGWKTNVFS